MFFVQIKKLNINPKNIAILSEKEIIRIEKKLKIQAKSSVGYENNNSEQLIDAIRNHKKALQLIYNNELLSLLVQGLPINENDVKNSTVIEGDDLFEVKRFWSSFIEPELIEQFKAAIITDKFELVNKWKHAHYLSSAYFKRQIEEIIIHKLDQITETLKLYTEKHYSFENIGFTKNKSFYQLLNIYADEKTDKWIVEFFLFCIENKRFFKGLDDTHVILVNLAKHLSRKSNDYLQFILHTLTEAGGSKKKRGLTIIKTQVLLIFIPLIIAAVYHEIGPPEEFKLPNDHDRAIHQLKLIDKNKRIKETYFKTWKPNNCDKLYVTIDNLKLGEKILGELKKESTINLLQTGDYLHMKSDFNQMLPITNDSFCVHNHQNQPVVLLLYFSVCKYERFDKLYPCKYPIAWNQIYISPNDSIFLSASALDSFSVKTGTELVKVSLLSDLDGTSRINEFQWCNETIMDMNLYKHTFVIKNKKQMNGAQIVLSKNDNKYQLEWSGAEHTLYDELTKNYLSNEKPFLIDGK